MKIALTLFSLLNQKNMIERFMETYLHRPIKILQFLRNVRIKEN